MRDSIAGESIHKSLSHILTRMGLRQLNEVEDGRDRLLLSNPCHQNIHEGTMIWRGPAIQLVWQLARVTLLDLY